MPPEAKPRYVKSSSTVWINCRNKKSQDLGSKFVWIGKLGFLTSEVVNPVCDGVMINSTPSGCQGPNSTKHGGKIGKSFLGFFSQYFYFIYRVQSAGIISTTPSHSPPKEGTAMYNHYDHYGLYQHVLYIYGSKAAGREKSALNVGNNPSV